MLNKYKIVGDVLIVYNRKDNREILFDADDFNFVSQHTWYIRTDKKRGYESVRTSITQASGKQISKIASRLLMNEPTGMLVDHENGNPFDNRKVNLRTATVQVNQHNRHSAKGYYWDKQKKKWKSQIRVNKKLIHLGQYATEDEARSAYLEAKQKYHPTAPHHLYQ